MMTTKPDPYFPFVVSVGLDTWRLVDMRTGETLEERPRAPKHEDGTESLDSLFGRNDLEAIARTKYELLRAA